jgi:hypothetical protein
VSSAAKLFSTADLTIPITVPAPLITDRLHTGRVIAFARNPDRNQAGIVIAITQEC